MLSSLPRGLRAKFVVSSRQYLHRMQSYVIDCPAQHASETDQGGELLSVDHHGASEEASVDDIVIMPIDSPHTLKKIRKPKKSKTSTLSDVPETNTATTTTRPGKKTLRKLRYQQTQLSPREYLWVSAQKLALSGHAHISYNDDTTRRPITSDLEQGEIGTPDSIRIVTSTDWGAASSDTTTQKPTVATVLIRPLLVLDLNGILCHRIRHNRPPPSALLSVDAKTGQPMKVAYRRSIANIANTPIIPRTDLVSFLQLLHQHFCVAIWTSAKAKTAKLLLQALVPPEISSRLLFVYAQHHCQAIHPAETNNSHRTGVSPTTAATVATNGYIKPLFEKDLSVVWKEFPLWNSNNTLLYDDSPEKCVKWQANAIHPPPLTGTALDDALQEQQMELLQDLAEHWTAEPGLQVWDAEGGDSTWSRSVHQADWVREQVQKLGWDQQTNCTY